MKNTLDHVAIIGAGLGGCALALALSQYDVPITLFESRPAKSEPITSGVVLTPNGLYILDRLGVLPRIKDRCYISTHRVFKNGKDETTRKTVISGEELYGYSNHRVWRSVLLGEMKQMLEERNVQIQYDSRFQGIVSEDAEGVEYRINDEAHRASMLVGVDGIYSTVRKYLAPDVVPYYTGTMGVLAHIKRASVAWPYEDYELNATIQDKPGAIFFIAEDPKGEDIMIGMQKQAPEYSREDLERLQHDKDKLAEFYSERYDEWSPTPRKIIDQVRANKENAFIWPFLKVPTLPRWFSETGRVILCGDGEHAMPPSSGQGINQCLEDVDSLTLLLTSIDGEGRNDKILGALSWWQGTRQRRVDAVFDWATNSTNVERMSEQDRSKLLRERKAPERAQADDMSWLYRPSLERDVKAWLAEHR
ncbi:uncharacterized protein LTR77_006209 [Saxophila tyrrhenica]|uniref:FAD-binding domain-containing protein n=1 Tax=Saxophila tyrrhenica TaxID=1690608 RepID=A0AAV9P7X8_9PEZI|nr:hypothetical protein LTR77_006209 [Saxophila tyrrhenica]